MMSSEDGCTCFDETTRRCPVCISYFTKKGRLRRVNPKRISEQSDCEHKWRKIVNPDTHNNNCRVCKKCGFVVNPDFIEAMLEKVKRDYP